MGLIRLVVALLGVTVFFAIMTVLDTDREGGYSPVAGNIMPAEAVELADTAEWQRTRELFGLPLPWPEGEIFVSGKVYTEVYDDVTCRIAQTQWSSGLYVMAVYPAYGAPLIWPDAMLPETRYRDFSLNGMPCTFFSGQNGCGISFSSEEASYILYKASAGDNEMLDLTGRCELR